MSHAQWRKRQIPFIYLVFWIKILSPSFALISGNGGIDSGRVPQTKTADLMCLFGRGFFCGSTQDREHVCQMSCFSNKNAWIHPMLLQPYRLRKNNPVHNVFLVRQTSCLPDGIAFRALFCGSFQDGHAEQMYCEVKLGWRLSSPREKNKNKSWVKPPKLISRCDMQFGRHVYGEKTDKTASGRYAGKYTGSLPI